MLCFDFIYPFYNPLFSFFLFVIVCLSLPLFPFPNGSLLFIGCLFKIFLAYLTQHNLHFHSFLTSDISFFVII